MQRVTTDGRRVAAARYLARQLVASGLAFALLLPTASAAAATGSLAGRTVVIDPGHGGIDPGAIANGLSEKNVTLPISLDVGALLTQEGAQVIYTRTGDVTVGPSDDTTAGLAARSSIANASHADIFISIHANALNDPSYSGLMTFYGTAGGYVDAVRRAPAVVDQSRQLAQDVQHAVQQQTEEIDRGVQSANFYVLGNTAMPSILVEAGFITNQTEARHLATPAYQEQVAEGVASGVLQFFADVGTVSKQTMDVDAGPVVTVSPPPFSPFWVETTQRTPLRSGPTEPSQTFTVLPQWSSLQVLAPQNGARFYVRNPASGGVAYVDADAVGPSGPPTFRPGNTPGAPAAEAAATHTAGPTIPGATGPTPPAGAPPTATYVVQPGDTLSAIARNLHVDVSTLVQANGLTNPNDVVAGSILHVPGARAGFQPFWAENFVTTPLWSGTDGGAKQLGTAAQFTPMHVLAPEASGRSLVRVYTTGGTAYVDTGALGPAGAPKGAE
jgi:N-acetylmuramoyl-L-alanine amidase/LysM repeat protein